eukprot:5920499-Pyramimonas_sp.AAC.2
MSQYIEYVADRLLMQLGYKPIWNSINPFDFMEYMYPGRCNNERDAKGLSLLHSPGKIYHPSPPCNLLLVVYRCHELNDVAIGGVFTSQISEGTSKASERLSLSFSSYSLRETSYNMFGFDGIVEARRRRVRRCCT